jgi:hypothetical protein
MKTVSWTRHDLVTGDPLPRNIPVTANGEVTITIPLAAYKRLVQWASVGRTVDAAMEECENPNVVAELADLKPALSACHQACRTHWANLPKEQTA